MAGREAGRGRISSIDRLPEWCDDATRWAFTALKERQLTQLEILDGLNERIRAAAWEQGLTDPEQIPQISRSAFNRRAMRLATLGRRLEETREIAAVLTPKLESDDGEKLALLLAQTIKTLTIEMLENAGELPANSDTAEMLIRAQPTIAPPAAAGAGKQASASPTVNQTITGADPARVARAAQREQERAIRVSRYGALHDIGSWA